MNFIYSSFFSNFIVDNYLIIIGFIIITSITNIYLLFQNQKKELLIGSILFLLSIPCLITHNILLIFILQEMMVLCSIALIFNSHDINSIQNIKNYLIIHLLSGFCILIGISYMNITMNTLEIHNITGVMNSKMNNLPYLILLLGLLINLGVPPFSRFLVENYSISSFAGLIYLLSFNSKIYIYLVMELFYGFENLRFIGIISMIYLTISACISKNIKIKICYLSLVSLSFLLIVIGNTNITQEIKFFIKCFLFFDLISKDFLVYYICILLDHKYKILNNEINLSSLRKEPLVLISLIFIIFLLTSFPILDIFLIKNVIVFNLHRDFIYYMVLLCKILNCFIIFNFFDFLNPGVVIKLKLKLITKTILLISISFLIFISFNFIKIAIILNYINEVNLMTIDKKYVIQELLLIIFAFISSLLYKKGYLTFYIGNIPSNLFLFVKNLIKKINFISCVSFIIYTVDTFVSINFNKFIVLFLLNKYKKLRTKNYILLIFFLLLTSFHILAVL